MKKSNCSIKFFLNERVTDKIKGSPIYCRIILNRKKAEFATDEFCHPSKWDKKNGLPIRNPRIKEYIAHIENEVFDIKRKLEYDKQAVSAKILKELYKNQALDEIVTILKHYDYFIDRISKLKEDYSEGRISQYRTSRNYFTDFLASINCKNLALQDFDLQKIQEYDVYLSTNIINSVTQKLISRNTVNNHHKKIKTLLNDAVRKGLIKFNPYNGFKLKYDQTNREFLNKDDLKTLVDFDFSNNQRLDKVRDIFVFSCYTGLRFTDAQNLTRDNVSVDSNGGYWLSFIQAKTNKTVRIPLLKHARKIYHKYDHLREVTKRIIPKISNQKFNDYIKIVADWVGIKKHLTHHIARHTFATTVTLSNEMPIEVVSAALGHNSLRTTQIYAKITDDYKLKQFDRLNEKL